MTYSWSARMVTVLSVVDSTVGEAQSMSTERIDEILDSADKNVMSAHRQIALARHALAVSRNEKLQEILRSEPEVSAQEGASADEVLDDFLG